MKQAIALTLPSSTLYVSGAVNDVSVTWTNTEGNTWEAAADRAEDDVYRVALTIVPTSGTTTTAEITLYYGILNLITDRTRADVFNGTDKGYYNAEDLNRVGSAVEYVAGRFADYGYSVDVSPRKDWSMGDIPREADMVKYLSEVAQLRSLVSVLPTTPETPGDMECLSYMEANNIEQILVDVDFLLTNMAAAWYYSGEIYAGEC
ncbi:hypothetical protein KQI82_12345 [Oscillibacter sp. MSJ-2]|uniref:Uncharacterized protein n=1 Tax=Dysosmobacter acutus TaxID=2841504 RepID=A0ABS6FEH1_9FIRM|nr:hypothetical protein [Dysosmobacter acutus]MBU5627699.1 hypothetical protein [Dysosmobacter acutus]